MPYEVVPKAFLYAAALLAVGLAVARRLLVAAAPDIPPDRLAYLENRLRRLPLLAAILALVSLGARAWAHTAASFGPAEAWNWEPLRLIALESRWGGAWQRQVLAAAGLALGAIGLARWQRVGWIVYTASAVIVCAMLPLLGHGAGSVWRTALHAGHLLGAGAWLGTLAAIVTIGQRAPLAESHGRRDLLRVLQRFSSVALTGAAVAAATGAVLAVLYLLSPINLIATAYGQALLVKLAGVGGIAWCGRRNWQRTRRGDAPSLGLIGTELGLAAAVVVVTSVLTELEQP